MLFRSTPAVGIYVHYQIATDALARLPPDAGRYFLPVIRAYRSGEVAKIAIRHFGGVVEFPSFHAAMALMTADALRTIRWLFFPACLWSGITLLSTIPIGGHYVVDLVAGIAVWAAFTLPHRLLQKPGRYL